MSTKTKYFQNCLGVFQGGGCKRAEADEKTEQAVCKKKIEKCNILPNKEDVAKELMKINKKDVDGFLSSLSGFVSRFIERIIILPHYG